MEDFHKINNVDQDAGNHDKKNKKRMPIWMLVATDILLTGVFLCVFALFHHVLPQRISNNQIIVATVDNSDENSFTLPSVDNESNNDTIFNDETDGIDNNTDTDTDSDNANNNDVNTTSDNTKSNTNTKNNTSTKKTNYGNTNTSAISSDLADSSSISNEETTTTKLNNYSDDNVELVTSKVEVGSGDSKITYYISDIYVTNVEYIKTAFATGEYGKNLRDSTLNMAEENNAILAISGDFYGNSEIGVVIRNGILYRSEVVDADICVFFTDGTMKTYAPDEFDGDEVIAQGAWQAWTFGPQLLDGNGNILSSFNTTTYLNSTNPRCAIGYITQGHYVFVVVDGRQEGYSKGVSLSELAQIMVEAGCNSAYNLDGGKSAAMVYQGEYVNQPADGGRTVSDIVYIAK
ncbi:MAG: phosphodiester glycosidase family protein [Mobilitalea sp.]